MPLASCMKVHVSIWENDNNYVNVSLDLFNEFDALNAMFNVIFSGSCFSDGCQGRMIDGKMIHGKKSPDSNSFDL